MDVNEEESRRERAIAALIASTRRIKRPLNLLEVASELAWLRHSLGNLKAVSEVVGLSPEMLREFLSVDHLTPSVRELIAEGVITSVDLAYRISRLGAEEQEVVAHQFIDGALSTRDARVALSLRKHLPERSILEIIDHVKKARDVRVYTAYFRVPKGKIDEAYLRAKLENVVGRSEIRSFHIEDRVCTVELTPLGRRKLMEAAKLRGLTLRNFMSVLVAEREA